MKQQLDWSGYRDYEYFREQERVFVLSFPIHDIPNHPILFIRDGAWVFMVDKETGYIAERLTLSDCVDVWTNEITHNPHFQKYYLGSYRIPKQHPDTARSIQDLKLLCSDSSRHRKGDTEYLLDFLNVGECSATETKVFMHLCKLVIVWNYLPLNKTGMHTAVGLSSKHCKRILESLESKGLIKILSDKFESKDGWCSLVKVHPKLYWKGRYSAWAVCNSLNYEYEDALELD